MEKGRRSTMLPRRKSSLIIFNDIETKIDIDNSVDSTDLPVHTALDEDIKHLAGTLGYTFKSQELLGRALTHRSMQMLDSEIDHYERLEFLGDAVLDLAVAHLLIEGHPEASEGELSKMRAALVNTESLADLARDLKLGPCVKLSKSEQSSGGADRSSILADVLEALFGALYREAGYSVALNIVSTVWCDRIRTVSPSDPKTELQEVLHILGKSPPKYSLECVEGPEHCPVFISVVTIDDEIRGRGKGKTKKLSQQEAAAEALANFSNKDS